MTAGLGFTLPCGRPHRGKVPIGMLQNVGTRTAMAYDHARSHNGPSIAETDSTVDDVFWVYETRVEFHVI